MPRSSQNKRPLVDSWRSLTRRDPQALLRVIPDASIVGVLLAAPLVMGGRDERGRLVYVMAVMVAVIVHAACNAVASTAKTAGWRRTGVDFVLIAGMALLCLQLVPLDWSKLTRLSPAMADYLPVWSGEEGSLVLGQWSTLSLDPYATRAQAAVRRPPVASNRAKTRELVSRYSGAPSRSMSAEMALAVAGGF